MLNVPLAEEEEDDTLSDRIIRYSSNNDHDHHHLQPQQNIVVAMVHLLLFLDLGCIIITPFSWNIDTCQILLSYSIEYHHHFRWVMGRFRLIVVSRFSQRIYRNLWFPRCWWWLLSLEPQPQCNWGYHSRILGTCITSCSFIPSTTVQSFFSNRLEKSRPCGPFCTAHNSAPY